MTKSKPILSGKTCSPVHSYNIINEKRGAIFEVLSALLVLNEKILTDVKKSSKFVFEISKLKPLPAWKKAMALAVKGMRFGGVRARGDASRGRGADRAVFRTRPLLPGAAQQAAPCPAPLLRQRKE